MYGAYTTNKPSTAPTMSSSSSSAATRATKAAHYKAELDAQIRAKSAASSNQQHQQQQQRQQHFTSSIPVGNRAHAIHGSGYEYALPATSRNGSDVEQRLLVKQRQLEYKQDLDRMVEMRREQELLDQQINMKMATSHSGSAPSSMAMNGAGGSANGNMLSQLGNHHYLSQNMLGPSDSSSGSAPQFGRGLSSMHTGVKEHEEYERMKQRQYRLELEIQMEEQKKRQQEIAPTISGGRDRGSSSRGSNRPSSSGEYQNYQHYEQQQQQHQQHQQHQQPQQPQQQQQQYEQQQQQYEQQRPSSFEFAGFDGLGQLQSNRNVRLPSFVVVVSIVSIVDKLLLMQYFFSCPLLFFFRYVLVPGVTLKQKHRNNCTRCNENSNLNHRKKKITPVN
tara:strand:- start:596 stop:1768 length:1173 start_codon:yes stop_codon:yes gene_type:complete